MTIYLKVKEFISRYVNHSDCGDDSNIFEYNSVNSLFAMQIILFVEKEFSITVEDRDLDIKNFQSINAIVAFIDSKLNTAAKV